MVGPLKNRETCPAACKTQTPAIPMIVGVCALLAIVAASTTHSLAENPAATDRSAAASPADSVNTLKTEIERLSTRLKKLQERVETSSNPPSELNAIRTKMNELAQSTAALALLTKKVESLDARVAATDKQVASFREQVVAVKEQRKRAADSGQTAFPTHHPETPSDGDITTGINAFKASRYKEASDLFRALTVSRPDDARVWYYAALSHALATNQWKDETIRLFNKAVEREKAGTPAKALIDASLASVTEPSVKKWVDYFRRAAQR
ncbi:hypothetical protein [Singulisphaera acidiphila]|uniref:Tetratricopeptide repeat protein n=1 Tax=Singulisphaera acidiphila (strain ATCC BAA-1392 / DSM 18658 / VKM B-2454 / MOB10) TaxID=886293 RepID=L0DJ59_SINAD|nr:hypothetical protein [Singulisphaera acidiphila]AGA28865.1 hypothetical protein Sinac_4688 [Singulisphaera acidiphila DSM 18658]